MFSTCQKFANKIFKRNQQLSDEINPTRTKSKNANASKEEVCIREAPKKVGIF